MGEGEVLICKGAEKSGEAFSTGFGEGVVGNLAVWVCPVKAARYCSAVRPVGLVAAGCCKKLLLAEDVGLVQMEQLF